MDTIAIPRQASLSYVACYTLYCICICFVTVTSHRNSPTWLSARGSSGCADTLRPTLPTLPCRDRTCLNQAETFVNTGIYLSVHTYKEISKSMQVHNRFKNCYGVLRKLFPPFPSNAVGFWCSSRSGSVWIRLVFCLDDLLMFLKFQKKFKLKNLVFEGKKLIIRLRHVDFSKCIDFSRPLMYTCKFSLQCYGVES